MRNPCLMFLSEAEKDDHDKFTVLIVLGRFVRHCKISAPSPFIFGTLTLINESLFFLVYSDPIQMG